MVAAVLVPLAIALTGHLYSKALKEREIQGQFVALAVTILRDSPRGDTTSALRGWAVNVLNKYSGVPISSELQSQLQTRLILPEQVAPSAPAQERRGLEALLAGNIDEAIAAFSAAERAQPGFHSAFEIARFLTTRRDHFATPADRQRVLRTILDQYSWGMPDDLLEQLRAAVRQP